MVESEKGDYKGEQRMKKFGKGLSIISVLFLSLTIISCGKGGGGGGDTSNDSGTNTNRSIPVIKDVRIFRQSAPEDPIEPSNGTIVIKAGEFIFYKVYYSDQDVDARYLVYTPYYPSTSTQPYVGPLPFNTTQSTVEDTYTSMEFSPGYDVRKWRLEFQIVDSQGNKSNIFTVYGDVVPGPAPVIKDVRFFRRSAPEVPIEPSNGRIIVNVGEDLFYRVYYSDQDVNVNLLYFTRYFPSTRTDPTVGPEAIILPPQSIVEDTYTSADGRFLSGQEGEWRLEFQLEDSLKNLSEIVAVYVEAR